LINFPIIESLDVAPGWGCYLIWCGTLGCWCCWFCYCDYWL